MSTTRFTSWMLYLCAALLCGASAALHAQSADIGIMKTGPDTATAGSNVTYTLTMQNAGPDDAAAAQFDDPVPAGMTFVSESQTGGAPFTCSTPSSGGTGTVTCSIATLPVGASASFTITLNIPMATPPGSFFQNTATVSSSTPDPNSENDVGVAGTLVPAPQADVAITKTGPGSAGPNSDVSYAISVSNFGPDAATNVSWSDTLPGTMTFVSFAQTSGPAFNCGAPAASTTCTLASLPSGSTATFTFVGHVPAGTPSGTVYTNTVSVKSDSDPNNGNDSATVSTTVSTVDIAITKSGPPTATAASTFNYVLVLTNNGPDPATVVRFNDPLPAGITFVALTQDTGPAATCVTPSMGAGGTVACTINLLNNGQSAQFTIMVAADSSVANGTIVSNTATASTDSFDTNTGNNAATASTTISAQADVAVTKGAPAAVTAGANLSYTLSVSNNGPSIATSVSLSDTLPAGETFVSLTQNSGPTFACTTGATVTCTIASLATGSTASFTLVANVAGSVANGTVLTNTANVSTTTPDPSPGNDSASASSTVQATADLALSKTGPASVTPGHNITYTLTLTNQGPSSASTVMLTDPLPAGENFVSLTQTAGPVFACTTPTAGSGGTVTCTNASLANGAAASFSLVVSIPANATTGVTLTNTATASSATPDPGGVNNSASAGVAIVQAAPAVVTPTPALDTRVLWLLAVLLAGIALRHAARGRMR